MSEVKKSGFATAGLVVGIVGVCLSFIPAFSSFSFVLGLLAIAFSIVTFVKKSSENTGIAAAILGALSIIITIVIAFTVHIKTVNTVSKVKTNVFDKVWSIIDKTFDSKNKTLDSLDDIYDSLDINLDNIIGGNTDEIMEKYLEVTFGEFEAEKGDYLAQTKLNLIVKNKSDKIRSFSIDIEAVDENGTRLATDTVYVERLGAGQSQKEQAFTLLDEEKTDELKNAEFRVYGASVN